MKRIRSITAVQAAFVAAWMLLLCASLGFKASARLLGWPQWDEFRLEENRRLADFPDLRHTPAKDWGAGLDRWYNDQFAFRSRIVQFYRWLHTDVLASPVHEIEIPGTGGWMYRNGGTWREIDDYLGVFELTPGETARWIEFFEGRVEWASAHGAVYLQAITPVKAQIHPEHLPPAVRHHRGQGVGGQVRAALRNSPARDHVLFLGDAIREITDRAGRTCFYPSDHHVNGYGCYVLYREIMAAAERFFGPPMAMPPFYDDPPAAVRDGLEPGCFQCGAPGYERLAVRMPGMHPVRSGAFDAVRPKPNGPIAFEWPGGKVHRTVVIAHDSFLRFPMYSWYHPDLEPVLIPLADGFDRAVTLMFARYTTPQLDRIVAAEAPAFLVEQFPEIRLTQAMEGYDETMRRAAAFARGTPITAEEAAALPEGTPLLARATLRDVAADITATLLADGSPAAAESTTPASVRALYFPPLPLGGHTLSLDLAPADATASSTALALRLPAAP